jgi:hypothetical protein
MRFKYRLASAIAGAMVTTAACGASAPWAPSPADQLTERVETPHYVFLYASGDRVNAEWQETYYAWISRVLDVNPARKIEYRKYRDRQHMGRLIGNSSTNGFADAATFTVHSIWSTDNHEVVHLYSSEWGSNVALFSEGFAVAHSADPAAGDLRPKWHSAPVHDVARQLRAGARLIALTDLATTASFRRFDPDVTYPEAGSFVRYLIDAQGLDRMKATFGRLRPDDSLERVLAVVVAIYGRTLSELEAAWLDDLAR